MSDTIMADGQEVDRACLLASLYNPAQPLGMGILHYDPTPMSREKASELLAEVGAFDFDYLAGRPLKVHERDGELRRGDLYDRDQGQGMFAVCVAEAALATTALSA